MQVTFSQIRGFVTVAATGSFTRAAKVLHLSQPALTARIRQFEDALDLRLFNRSTRTLELTEEGRELLPIFMRLVGDLEGAVNGAKARSQKTNCIIRLACLPSCAATLLPELILKFRTENPDTVFVVEDAINSQIHLLVREARADFGICAYKADEPDLIFEELFEDNLQVVYRPNHPVHRVRRVTITELVRYPLILTSRGSSVRQVVDRAFAATGQSSSPACEVNYMSTAVALVQGGLGITILPSTAVEARSPGVMTRKIDDDAFIRKLFLVRRKSTRPTRIAQHFADAILKHFPASQKTFKGPLLPNS